MKPHTPSPATSRCIIVAVDGPAGSGKSSVCAQVCRELGWTYVNTGLIYRALAYICRSRSISLEDDSIPGYIIEEFCEKLRWDAEASVLWFGHENLTPKLATDQAGRDASLIAKSALVREKLLPLQRKLALLSPKGAIVDGRDIGTVVFPDADLKIFMTASIEERARRRIQQINPHTPVDSAEIEAIKKSISERDTQDAARGTAPLLRADDAIDFDTSSLNLEAATQKLLELIRSRGLFHS